MIEPPVTSPYAPPPEEAGVKYDGDKTRYELLPPHALKHVADVLTFGAKKYPQADNWKRVPNLTERYTGAAMRHMEAFRRGERLDPETGLPHLAHAMCCLLFILEHEHETTDV